MLDRFFIEHSAEAGTENDPYPKKSCLCDAFDRFINRIRQQQSESTPVRLNARDFIGLG